MMADKAVIDFVYRFRFPENRMYRLRLIGLFSYTCSPFLNLIFGTFFKATSSSKFNSERTILSIRAVASGSSSFAILSMASISKTIGSKVNISDDPMVLPFAGSNSLGAKNTIAA